MKTFSLSQSDYARHRGVSRASVTYWKRSGKLILNDDGKVDVAASDAALEGRPDVYRGGRASRLPHEPAAPKPAKELAAALAGIGDAAGWTTAEATRRKEIALASLRQLEFDLKSGAVVSIADVQHTVEAEYGVVRDRILQAPGKLADRLLDCSDRHKIETLIRAELYEALSALAGRARGAAMIDERLLAALRASCGLLRPPPAQSLIEPS